MLMIKYFFIFNSYNTLFLRKLISVFYAIFMYTLHIHHKLRNHIHQRDKN